MNCVEAGLVVRTEKLTEKQQEFVLRKVAAFYRLREIADRFRAEFPDCGLNDQELYNKIRYMAQDKKTDKWQKKIEEYREELRKRPINSYAIGNQFDRIRILQRLIDIVAEANIRRVIWYPIRRDPNGTMHYGREEVWEPNYQAVIAAIRLVHEEMKKGR